MHYVTSIAILAGINIIIVSGLTILTGFTGMFSMGHAGFMAIGGYTAAVLNMYLHVPFLLALVLGGVVAVLSSLIVGIPTIRSRLTGDCFAIAMLGFGEAVRLLISNTYPVLNGALGLTGIPKKTTIYIVIIAAVVTIYLVRNYLRSHYGKNCVAVQQQEIAAEMMGIDVAQTKLWSLMLSAFFAGVGGGLYGFYMTGLYPINFAQARSTDLIAAVVFGGTNTVTGPVVAAALLVLLPEILRVFSKWRLVLYGLMFVALMRFKPEGLWGYREFSFAGVKKVWKNFINLFHGHRQHGRKGDGTHDGLK